DARRHAVVGLEQPDGVGEGTAPVGVLPVHVVAGDGGRIGGDFDESPAGNAKKVPGGVRDVKEGRKAGGAPVLAAVLLRTARARAMNGIVEVLRLEVNQLPEAPIATPLAALRGFRPPVARLGA